MTTPTVNEEREGTVLLTWTHRHGVTTSLYTSEEAAHIGFVDMLVDTGSFFEVADPAVLREIRAAYKDGDLVEVVRLYCQATNEEFVLEPESVRSSGVYTEREVLANLDKAIKFRL